MPERSFPALSVVLACTDSFPTVARTVAALARQSCADRIELLIVTPSWVALKADAELLAAFHGWRCVETGPLRSIAQANAAGVRAATAEVIALAEDHCFPEPGWAAALLAAHQGPYAAVGPAVCNANPATSISWADFLIGYAPWAAPCIRAEREFLPGHNSSYKRAVLLEEGEGLEAALESETVFHFRLRARGDRLLLEPEARARHMNIAKAASWLPLQFHNGRVFGGARLSGRPLHVRLAYAAGSPAIPLLRLVRTIRDALRSRVPTATLLRTIPWLVVGLTLDGVGQACGALWGVGKSAESLRDYEFRRIDHVPESDLVALGAADD